MIRCALESFDPENFFNNLNVTVKRIENFLEPPEVKNIMTREEISGRKRRWGFKNHVKFEKKSILFIFVKTLATYPDGSKSLPKHPLGPKRHLRHPRDVI